MNKQDSVDLLHPSMLQIQYLMELEKVGKKRGSVTMIADICGVSHGPVSRFFKECMERGYLTEKYEFTAEGTHALQETSAGCETVSEGNEYSRKRDS